MKALIIGSGRVAIAFAELSSYQRVEKWEDEIADVYFILNQEDSLNIKTAFEIRLKSQNPIFTTLHEDKVGFKIQAHLNNFYFVNHVELASAELIKGVLNCTKNTKKFNIIKPKRSFKVKIDPLVKKSLYFIFGLTISSLLFFWFHSGSLIESLYLTVTILSGEIISNEPDTISTFFICALLICGVTNTAVIFALVTDAIIKRRQELSWGIKKYKGENHIIVIGASEVGFRVIEKLTQSGEKIVLVDKDLTGSFLKEIAAMKIPFVIGDGKDDNVLIAAGLEKAKAVMAITKDDLVNLEIGLGVKTINPDIRVVCRIFDQQLSESLKQNDIIKYSYSMGYITANALLKYSKLQFKTDYGARLPGVNISQVISSSPKLIKENSRFPT